MLVCLRACILGQIYENIYIFIYTSIFHHQILYIVISNRYFFIFKTRCHCPNLFYIQLLSHFTHNIMHNLSLILYSLDTKKFLCAWFNHTFIIIFGVIRASQTETWTHQRSLASIPPKSATHSLTRLLSWIILLHVFLSLSFFKYVFNFFPMEMVMIKVCSLICTPYKTQHKLRFFFFWLYV